MEKPIDVDQVINAHLARGEVFFGMFPKPFPFFLPMLETLSRAILAIAPDNHQAIVYVDGSDKKKAAELTNALRLKADFPWRDRMSGD